MSVTPAAEAIRTWREHPARMVQDLFGVTPDPWQIDVLESFPHSPRLCMLASKGPGKTTALSWLAWNYLLTRPEPKIAATSISADNLADNLWAEMAKWQGRSPLLRETFEWTKTRISNRQEPENWFMTARTWPKTGSSQSQADTLAGLHADYILFILDESGGIPDAVMATAEAALASCVEGYILQAGNPTQLSGPLYRAATSDKRLWKVVEVNGDPDNPKRAPRVSIEWARQQIELYGRDNPWVLVNVFGKFPPAAFNTLIGMDDVQAAIQRAYRMEDIAASARVLGVDVARYGDDKSVIAPRQGLFALDMVILRNVSGTAGADQVARRWIDWDADGCFVDDTGGYGSSWIDNLIRLGHSPIGVGFASKAADPLKYANKRAEMAFELVDWIKRGGRIPDIPELTRALTETTYTFAGDRLLIEPKEQIKARLGFSPDEMDALMLTFAAPVQRRPRGLHVAVSRSFESDYDPYAQARAVGQQPQSGYQRNSWMPGQIR